MTPIQALGFEIGKGMVWFILGFVVGYITRGIKERIQTSVDNEKFIALLVSIVWATSVLVDMLIPSYDTPFALHGLMGSIVGFYYKRLFSKNEKDQPEETSK